ncbi:DRTGG domain-containing protein [Aciduricibacillus chroicocephali]|uniref:DRTGG domain-containing protein n=1 Tax=Aciduricibacillus chroicocephali TaxID=3054939 RepID=A0ABY9KZ04_9BACI|nr:DRTGG domain-containing protein [Bacillaceae bacterium 44XB]
MATKHEQIIQHIHSLKAGSKISVRQIAKTLQVSDGTAYRAIKDAETQGLVSTIERVGTIRIEKKNKDNFEKLSFAEIINIVDGQVLGGRNGLHKTLHKFLIGAMQLDAMMGYTEAGSLLIVGNRVRAHELALKAGAAVLVTGGFDTEESIKRLADEKNLPIISTSYDTFTVATMINRAIYDQLIKKEIVFVSDIARPFDKCYYLKAENTVHDWHVLNNETAHTRFPVINEERHVVGMVASKDILRQDHNILIEKVMTKHPQVVQEKTSLAFVAHMMVWEGIEVVPVVDENQVLTGIVTRQDVLKALQHIQRQPQIGETIEDIIAREMTESDEKMVYETIVAPQMTNQLGTLSNGVFTSIMIEAASRLMHHMKKGELVVENLTVFFIKPVQIDTALVIKPHLLEAGRIYAKVEVEIFNERKLVGKGMIMAQLIDR